MIEAGSSGTTHSLRISTPRLDPRLHHPPRHRDLGATAITLGQLPGTVEDVPAIKVSEHVSDGDPEPMADIDTSTNLRVRSLYPYETQRAEDLNFGENVVIEAHPSKFGGDWWYGTTVNDGRSGFSPQTYVPVVEPVQATALYSYEGSSPDELSFTEGDALTVVDCLESGWWRAERDGVVYAVPAAFVEA
ncbi:hypothetical protein BKA83DRAFT_4322698 [Pisolithus microcarpus]|nr:hypothetical protein BKA83DRAFT_4322698 [Pisolithus microcarpus]